MRKIFVLISMFSIILIFSLCSNGNKEKPLPYLNLSDSARYVGIETCKQCHQSIYNTFIETGMGQSFAMASREKTSARFSSHDVIYDSLRDLSYQPFWKNDSLYLKEYRLDGHDTIHSRTETINYIIGSGQHTNSHMYIRNGYLFQAPATYYTQKGRWDLPPGFEHKGNVRFDRAIGLECMSCHNSFPSLVKGSENKYEKLPQGINCERCHGPGSIHVNQKKAGKLVDISSEIDYSIVNPAKLPVDYQFQICQRCHLQGNAVLKEGKSFYDFRPGMKLQEVMDVYMPKFSGRENEFIMASHVERLKMSACFMKTMADVESGKLKADDPLRPYKNALTCVTCHNPHVSVKVTGKETFNNACRNCHNGSQDKTVCKRKLLAGEQIQSGNCVNCHMPKSNTIDIPHVVTTDHFIRRPVEKKTTESIKKFLGLVCINNPGADERSRGKAFIQYVEGFSGERSCLDSAENLLSRKPDYVRDLIHALYLKENYSGIIALVQKTGRAKILNEQHAEWLNRDAWLDFRIGLSYRKLGNEAEALIYLQEAHRLASHIVQISNELAGCLLANGKQDEAFNLYQSIVKADVRYPSAFTNLGYLYLLRENNTTMAEKLYKRALYLDPDNEQALVNISGLLFQQKRLSEAKKYIVRLRKYFPGNSQGKLLEEAVML